MSVDSIQSNANISTNVRSGLILLFLCLLIAMIEQTSGWIIHHPLHLGNTKTEFSMNKRKQNKWTTNAEALNLESTSNDQEEHNDYDSLKIPVEKKYKKAYPQQTPHSGRHFLPSHPAYDNTKGGLSSLLGGKTLIRRLFRPKRFMEGWYYRLTLVEENVTFAFIMSIEDPGIRKSDLRMCCIQVDGPNEEYLVQADPDDTKFWAWKGQQGLGCIFEYNDDDINKNRQQFEANRTALSKNEWNNIVRSGFQVLPSHLIGTIRGHDGSKGGILPGQGITGYCDFDISISPKYGWGGDGDVQKSTAGWLASFPVFEPHWQVTLADATATGSVVWNGVKYTFQDQPFYAEKNWGQSLPLKWYWTQCNSFNGYDNLSVTAGGGVRKVPFGQETMGMVSVHYNGKFYEAVPWKGNMQWKVDTWGYWYLRGQNTFQSSDSESLFEVEIIYSCDPSKVKGLKFRAPTPDQGMVYFCRNTFDADVTLSLWELEYDSKSKTYIRKTDVPPIIDRATSSQGGAEVGGGPWWDTWEVNSIMKKPIKFALQVPYRIQNLRRRIFLRRRK